MFKKLGIGVAVGAALLFTLAVPSHAATDLGNTSNLFYVKVKKPIFTGQYKKVNGHKGQRLLTPKGTIMRVVKLKKATSGHPSEVVLTRGLISHKLQQKVYDPRSATYQVKHFNTTYFEPYKLKMPLSEYMFQAGTFSNTKSAYYKPIFNITMDGYLQYYSPARLKHYHIQTTWLYGKQPKNGRKNPIYTIKPTQAVKINQTKTSGKYFNLYYKQPINGLKEKKLHNSYRLTIHELADQSKTWNSGKYAYQMMWRNYKVGNQPFYYLWGSETNDPGYLG